MGEKYFNRFLQSFCLLLLCLIKMYSVAALGVDGGVFVCRSNFLVGS